MRKLLMMAAMLLLLPLCARAEDAGIPEAYLSRDTLTGQAETYFAQDVLQRNLASFLARCPEADAETVRCVTPSVLFVTYSLFQDLYTDATGSAWLADDASVLRLCERGWRLTSLTPFMADYGQPVNLLFTRQRGSATEICLLERATGSIRVLLRAQEPLVLMEPDALYQVDYLPDASYLLLCAAEITQPDPGAAGLVFTVTEVAGEIRMTDGEPVPAIWQEGRVALIPPGDRAADLAAFTDWYCWLYPDHNVTPGPIAERFDLLDDPAIGRLYEVRFNGSVWLWRDDAALCLAGMHMDDMLVSGLTDLANADVTGDGVEDLIYVYCTGSGFVTQHAVFYDPVSEIRTALYSSSLSSRQDELHLSLQDGRCLLQQNGKLLRALVAYPAGMVSPASDRFR